MKLGYIFTNNVKGADRHRIEINPEGWNSVVKDERRTWEKYAVNKECVAITMLKDGFVLAVVCMTGGDRTDNNITTWVFVPSSIRISGKELKEVIEEIKSLNQQSIASIGTESFTSNKILDRDYPQRQYPVKSIASIGEALACRYATTDWSLNDILNRPFQKKYSKYKYIFLFENKEDMKEGLTDLSNENIDERICVLPPSTETKIQRFGTANVKLTNTSTGMPFDQPLFATKGEVFDLTATKVGCIPQMNIQAQAVGDEEEVEISGNHSSWRVKISPLDFKVVDSVTQTTLEARTVVDIVDANYDPKNGCVPEDNLSKISVRVSAKGYQDKQCDVNLTKKPVHISLEKEHETAKYEYTDANGQLLTITIEGPGAKASTPIRGYTAKGKRLVFNEKAKCATPISVTPKGPVSPDATSPKFSFLPSRFPWFAFGLGAAAGLIFSLVALLLFHQFDSRIGTKQESSDSENSAVIVHTPNVMPLPKSADAIEYLKTSSEWKEKDMEDYPNLKGLYYALNHYQFDNVLQRRAEFQGVKEFQEICDKITQLQENGMVLSSIYTDDGVISVQKYIDTLNKKIESVPANKKEQNEASGSNTSSSKTASSTNRLPSMSAGDNPNNNSGNGDRGNKELGI